MGDRAVDDNLLLSGSLRNANGVEELGGGGAFLAFRYLGVDLGECCYKTKNK